jgi:tetratricopeptide (TPR) repeat protein
MYQDRISKWGIDKKLKAGEARHALRQIDLRRSMGRETEISIRGTLFSERKLRRHVERSRLSPGEEAATPEAVIARTPPPEGISPSTGCCAAGSASNTPRSFAADLGEPNASGRKRPRSGSPESAFVSPNFVRDSVSPDALHPSPESTFRSIAIVPQTATSPSRQARASSNALNHIDQYYNLNRETRWWMPLAEEETDFDLPQGPGYPSAVTVQHLGRYFETSKQADPASVVHSVQISCQLFRSQRFGRGSRCLDSAHSQIKTLLLEQLPLLLPCLLSAVCLLDFLREEMKPNHDQLCPLRLFLEFVSEMAEVKLGSGHSITQLLLSLAELRSGHHLISQTAMQRIGETFRRKLDPQHPFHFQLVYNHAWVLIWRRQFDEARAALEDFPYPITYRPDDDDPQYRASRYLLAQLYIALHRWEEAARCFHEIIEQAKKGLGEERAHSVTFEAWRMLAVVADYQQDVDARSRWEQETFDCGEMAFGPHDPRVLKLQRVMAGSEPRVAPADQCRFICSFPPLEDWT